MTRPSLLASIVVLAAVVLSYGCTSPPVDWGAFAMGSYVDANRAEGPRDKFGWFIGGQRAGESMVTSTEGSWSQSDWRAVRATLTERGVSSALVDAIVTDSQPLYGRRSVTVWATDLGGRAMSLNVSIRSAGAPLAEIWDDELDRLVPTAGVRDRISAVLWVEGGQVTIVRLVEVAREDYEEPDDLLWWLQDVIDLDRDGAPDLVLASYGYEATSLAIASVVENEVVDRWEGLGRGM